MIKKLCSCALVLLLTSCLQAMADNYTYLTVTQTSTGHSFELAQVERLGFANDQVTVYLTNGSQQRFNLEQVEALDLTDQAAGISNMTSDDSCMSLDNGTLSVQLSKASSLQVFNTKGELVVSTQLDKGEHVLPLQHLNKGVYLIKLGRQTLKTPVQ